MLFKIGYQLTYYIMNKKMEVSVMANYDVYNLKQRAFMTNDFVRNVRNGSKATLTEMQQDLFIWVVASAMENVRDGKPFNEWVRFHFPSFWKYRGGKDWTKYSKEARKDYMQMFKDMQKVQFEMVVRKVEFGKEELCRYTCQYIDAVEYNESTKEISVRLSATLGDLVCTRKKNYTDIEVGHYMALKDKLAKVLYEYLRSYVSLKHTSISVEALLKMIGATYGYGNLKQKHLLKAIKEINEKTDITLMGHHTKYQELFEKRYKEQGNVTDDDVIELIVLSMENHPLNRKGEEMKKVTSLLFNIKRKNIEERYDYVDYMGFVPAYATKLKKALIEYSAPRTVAQAISESRYEEQNYFDD